MRWWVRLCWSFCLGSAGLTNAEVVTYILAPGSTITAYLDGLTIGPEPIVGSFDWVGCGSTDQATCFDTTRLDFQSPSFSIHLNSPNQLAGGVLYYGVPLFDETVDAPGVFTGLAEMTSVYREGVSSEYPEGVYADRAWFPLSLTYPDIRIMPYAGGLTGGVYLAALDIKAVADRDHDGVLDDIDDCPDTPPGTVVNESGCSMDQLASCAGPGDGEVWKNHGQYVKAVVKVANAFQQAGLISPQEERLIVQTAIESNCGKK